MTDEQPVQKKRSRRLYVYWGVALALLLTAGLVCWLMVVPVWQVRRLVALCAADFTKVEAGILDIGGYGGAARRLRLYLRLPQAVAPHKTTAAEIMGLCGDTEPFNLGKHTVSVYDAIPISVSPNIAPRKGEQYWIAVVKVGTPDSNYDYAAWQFVTPGSQLGVPAPTQPGVYEVRLHARYSTLATCVVFRRGVTVIPGPAGKRPADLAASFTLKSGGRALKVGSSPVVVFNKPLAPRMGERYWIAVVTAGSPDSEYGQWRYLEAGAREAKLPAIPAAGNYEIRLHARFSTEPHRVIHRAKLTVR